MVQFAALLAFFSTSSPVALASPPPPSVAPPTRSWDEAYSYAKGIVAGLSLAEQVKLASGVGWQAGPCVGNIQMSSANFNLSLCLQDSPTGVRFANNVSSFSASMNVAATFDRSLMLQHGEVMGREFKGKGVNVMLGPMMNVLRAPAGGRNWEGQGADPYLVAESARLQVRGVQSNGVMATAKHFVGNEQEHFRQGSSSQIDDRTLHEVYLKPFQACVEEGVAAIMCSYNLLNQTYACENENAIQNILKGQLGFKGFVMSDWWATGNTTGSANAGTDMMMPSENSYGGTPTWGQNLIDAVNSTKQVDSKRVADMATRIIASWYKVQKVQGEDQSYPALNFDSWTPSKSQPINVQADHSAHIRSVGAASSILLKNVGNALPLQKNLRLAILGSDAGFGNTTDNASTCSDHGCSDGTIAVGWGSGTANFPYIVTPFDGVSSRAQTANCTVSVMLDDYNLASAGEMSAKADVVLVFVSADSGEGYITVDGNEGDRNNLTLWHNGDNLINQAAATNSKVIVVIHGPGAILMPWIDHPSIVGVIHALFPGQESGNAIADVLFGDVNPSGRLPFTINRRIEDYSASIMTDATVPAGFKVPQVTYSEGLFLDYRWNDQHNIDPLFAFGFGLSYTTFTYKNFVQSQSKLALDTKAISVSFTVHNTGLFDGHEVAQLYLGFPPTANEPPKQLKDFKRQMISKSHSSLFNLSVPVKEMKIWSVEQQKFVLPTGTFTIYIGSSSRDIKWQGTFDA